jgi:hypothetical protein
VRACVAGGGGHRARSEAARQSQLPAAHGPEAFARRASPPLPSFQEGKWLLCNLQSNSEFDSHRLNRDTWNQPALKELLQVRACQWF